MAEAVEHRLLDVELVDAERIVWSGPAQMVIARTTEGDLGVLPGHQPLLGILHGGVVEIRDQDNKIHVAAVADGFLSVARDRVSILAEHAELSHEIDLEDARESLSRAREELGMAAGSLHETVAAKVRAAEGRVRAAQVGNNGVNGQGF